MPSPPPAGALSPAGSGDAAQWAAPITDRHGSGDQALNGAHWAPAPPKGGGETWLPLWGRYVPVGRCPAADRGGSRDAVAVRRLRGPTPSCPRAEDGKMALLGSNPHKTWVFEQCHVALFVEIALLLYFKLLKQTPSETRFLWFELCHFPLNCAMWHCSQSRINTGFFANSAKFSSQAVGRREGRSLLGEIDKF